MAFIVWVLMRLVCIDCSLSEVRQRQYQTDNKIEFLSEEIGIDDKKVEFLKDKKKEAGERRDRVDTKARTLLTVTSLLLGLVSSATSIASAKSVGFWSIVPLTLLFVTIFILTAYFGVDRRQTTDYSYVFLDAELESAIRELCNDLIKIQDYNERVTDFMIDLYRSALRYFSIAMFFIMILGIGNIVFTDSDFASNKDRVQAFFVHEFYSLKKSLDEVDVLHKDPKIIHSQ